MGATKDSNSIFELQEYLKNKTKHKSELKAGLHL